MPASELTTTPLERLCAALQEGLHVAAQPLTLIQVALSRECTAMLSEAELRDLSHSSAVESDRAARLFRILGQLVESHRVSPVLRAIDLQKLVASCIRARIEVDPALDLLLESHVATGLPPVNADEQATAGLMRTLLETIQALAAPGEKILVSCKRKGRAVQLSLSSRNSLMRIAGELRVVLLLASAVMERQGGTASCWTSPFVLDLMFDIFPKEKNPHEQ